MVRWDANNNGKWEDAFAVDAEQIGFRLRHNAIETLRGAASCHGSSWEKMTETARFTVTQFQVNKIEINGYAPRFVISIAAIPARHRRQLLRVTHQVTGFNLL